MRNYFKESTKSIKKKKSRRISKSYKPNSETNILNHRIQTIRLRIREREKTQTYATRLHQSQRQAAYDQQQHHAHGPSVSTHPQQKHGRVAYNSAKLYLDACRRRSSGPKEYSNCRTRSDWLQYWQEQRRSGT